MHQLISLIDEAHGFSSLDSIHIKRLSMIYRSTSLAPMWQSLLRSVDDVYLAMICARTDASYASRIAWIPMVIDKNEAIMLAESLAGLLMRLVQYALHEDH